MDEVVFFRNDDFRTDYCSGQAYYDLAGIEKLNGYVGWDYYYQIGSWGAIK
ncbi:MAG: hypothetical protein ACI396_01155 [Acutalibacteraceae bacterium]